MNYDEVMGAYDALRATAAIRLIEVGKKRFTDFYAADAWLKGWKRKGICVISFHDGDVWSGRVEGEKGLYEQVMDDLDDIESDWGKEIQNRIKVYGEKDPDPAIPLWRSDGAKKAGKVGLKVMGYGLLIVAFLPVIAFLIGLSALLQVVSNE